MPVRGLLPAPATPATVYTRLSEIREHADIAFQPIVSIHTGAVFGYEALMRGHDALGYRTPPELLDAAAAHGLLHHVERLLREVALSKFSQLPWAADCRLFLNVDPRVLAGDTIGLDELQRLLTLHELDPRNVVFEITELHELSADPVADATVRQLRAHGHRLAIDDFGTGFSGLKSLYQQQPDLIKIDRFFISNISDDHKKKLFVSHAVELAHVLGVQVLAEGVETREELLTCREIGCDLVQGYLIARPTTDTASLGNRYADVRGASVDRRAAARQERSAIESFLVRVPPVRIDEGIGKVFDALREHKQHGFVPIIDRTGVPLGVLHEQDLKDYIYSRYGKALLLNPHYGKTIGDFLRVCPIVDVHSTAEQILEAYTAETNAIGVMLVEDFSYIGFLTADALLKVIEQRNVDLARDQNPLTGLPGNNRIMEFVQNMLDEEHAGWCIAYFDFNHFKAFNDTYGFRQGDRIIKLFSELLRKHLGNSCFIGHVGGDDFVAVFRGAVSDAIRTRILRLVDTFARDAESFYDHVTRKRGRVTARDRSGIFRDVPLVSCCAALLAVSPGCDHGCDLDHLVTLMAATKSRCKLTRQPLLVEHLGSLLAQP